MTIVSLEDGTSYLIDTNYRFDACNVVEYKLKDRLDCRKVSNVIIMEDCILDKTSQYYNSGYAYDDITLRAKTGWDYKWR